MTTETKQTSKADGAWLSTATEANRPGGELVWHTVERRGFTAMVGKCAVASIRRTQHGFSTRLTGWEWTITPAMGISRFGMAITSVPIRFFKRHTDAKKSVEAAWATPRSAKAKGKPK